MFYLAPSDWHFDPPRFCRVIDCKTVTRWEQSVVHVSVDPPFKGEPTEENRDLTSVLLLPVIPEDIASIVDGTPSGQCILVDVYFEKRQSNGNEYDPTNFIRLGISTLVGSLAEAYKASSLERIKSTRLSGKVTEYESVQFLCEHDDYPEQKLIKKLCEFFKSQKVNCRAFLVRASIDNSADEIFEYNLTLCICGMAPSPELLEEIEQQLAKGQGFLSGDYIDIIFCTKDQEAKLHTIAKPFYPTGLLTKVRRAFVAIKNRLN